jgi:hypothetical protein
MFKTRLGLILCTGLMACASSGISESGLLGDTSGFERRGDSLLVDPLAGADSLRGYTRVHMEPVLVYLGPEARERGVGPVQQRHLGQLFRRALRTELSQYFVLVGDPAERGSDLMDLRVVITDVEPGDPESGVPGNGTVEVELLATSTGERLVAAISRKWGRAPHTAPDEKHAEAEFAFQAWSTELREWLVAATGR